MQIDITKNIKTVVESARGHYPGEVTFSNKYGKVLEMS